MPRQVGRGGERRPISVWAPVAGVPFPTFLAAFLVNVQLAATQSTGEKESVGCGSCPCVCVGQGAR